MTIDEAKAWALLVGVVTTSIVSIITAIKMQTVHKLVNQNFTDLKNANAGLEVKLTASDRALQEEIRKTMGQDMRSMIAAEMREAQRLALALPVSAPTGAPLPVIIAGAEATVPVTLVPSTPEPSKP